MPDTRPPDLGSAIAELEEAARPGGAEAARAGHRPPGGRPARGAGPAAGGTGPAGPGIDRARRRKAGREFREELQAEALPTAGNA